MTAQPADCPALPDGPHLSAEELRSMESLHMLDSWRKYVTRYGPVFTLRAQNEPPRVYVSDPAAIRDLFISSRVEWEARGTLYFRPVIGAQALPYLHGTPHLDVRRLLGPPLHGDRVRNLGPAIEDITTDALARLHGGSQPLIDLTREITLRLIVRVAFGLLPEKRYGRLVRLLSQIMELMDEPTAAPQTDPATLLKEISTLVQQVQQIVDTEAAAARHAPGPHRDDLLHHLATSEPPQPLEQVRGHIMSLLIAGHDTTASALAWAVYQLELHPAARRRLRAEIDTPGPNPEPAEVAKLPYLAAVCAETLRHGSVVPAGLARIAPEELEWGGHRFPAGTELVPAIHLVHYRPDLYLEPDRFRPERFLNRKPSGAHYLPFGSGTRRCPGAELAGFEMPVVIARLLRTPGLRLVGAQPGLKPLKSGPTMSVPATLRVALDNPPQRTTAEGRGP